MRALLFAVLIGLIGAGAFYVLSGAHQSDSKGSSVASTLKELASHVISAADGEETETNGGGGDGDPGLGGWFGKGDQEEARSSKDVYYQYVDDSGTVHFVQNLGDVPARWQNKVGRIEVEETAPAPGSGSRPSAAGPGAAKRYGERPAAYKTGPEVVVYTTAWCGWCRKTLAFLDERGVHYVNKDIEANDGNREELIQKTGRTSIPVVEIDGEIIRGFNAARMEQLLAGSG